MRTRFQALLGSTALAGAIAAAALVSSGSTRFANADIVTDTVREQLTALMNSQGAALPEATRTAVSATLNGTSDSAELMAQLNGLALQNAALAQTIGMALGKASLSLELSNLSAASQLNGYVSSASNANIIAGYNSAKTPITALNASRSTGRLVAQESPPDGSQEFQNLFFGGFGGGGGDAGNLGTIQTFAGGGGGGGGITRPGFTSFTSSSMRQTLNSVASTFQAFKIGPYST